MLLINFNQLLKKGDNQFNFAMGNKYLFLFLLSVLSLFSCSKEEAIIEEVPMIMIPFAGNWTGDLNGEIRGTLTMLVREDGLFFMEIKTIGAGTRNINGTVTEDGVLEGAEPSGDPSVSLKLTGTLELTRGAGEWEAKDTAAGLNEKGEWVVEKEV